jgi:hypothetical protein
MALKSKEWFYKQCLREVKRFGRFSHLSWDILEKGIGQHDSTRGHVTQAIGACQEFLEAYPQHIAVIQAADPTMPFDVVTHAQIQTDLGEWLAGVNGPYGRNSFGYDFDTLKNILPPNLGGHRRGGGGGGDEFKRVLRLITEWT